MGDFHRAEDRGSAVACDVVVGAGAYGGFAQLLESIGEDFGGGGAESGRRDLFAEAGLIVALEEDHVEARLHVHDRNGNGDAAGVRLLSSAALTLLLRGHVVGRTFAGGETGGIDEIEVHRVAVIRVGGPRRCGRGSLRRVERSSEKKEEAGWISHAEMLSLQAGSTKNRRHRRHRTSSPGHRVIRRRKQAICSSFSVFLRCFSFAHGLCRMRKGQEWRLFHGYGSDLWPQRFLSHDVPELRAAGGPWSPSERTAMKKGLL